MRSRSAPGSSTPTWRRTKALNRSRLAVLVIVLPPLTALYVIESFIAPVPLLRIAMRTLPVLPLGVWTLWFDSSRPLAGQPLVVRTAGRVGLLLMVMIFAVAVLGIGLNWLYEPRQVI